MTPKSLLLSILKKAYSGTLISQSPNDKPVQKVFNYLKTPCWFSDSKNKKYLNDNSCPEMTIPSSWAYIKLGYLLNFISTGKNYKYEIIENQNYCIGQRNNQEYGFEKNGIKYIGSDNWKSIPKDYFLKHNDVLVNSLGTGTMGRCGIWKSNLNKSTFDSCVFVLRSNELLYPDYLYYYLKLNRTKLERLATGTTNQKSINKKEMVNLFIPLAPLNEQKRIVAKIEELLPLIDKYEKAWTKLEKFNSDFPLKMEKSILEYAIQGKLVEQRSNEGTGEDLLKKLKNSNFKTDYKVKEKHISEIKKEDIPFDAPKNWTWVRLGSVCVIARGGSPRPINAYLTDDKDGLNWIKIGDTEKNGKYITSAKQKIKKEGLNRTREVHPGDFLLTNSMSFGRPYITKINGCVHDGWLIISQQEKIFDQDFLYYLLSSGYAYNQFSGKVSGAVVKNLNSDKVANSIFPLPPLKEQERIVAKIEELLPLCKQLIRD